GTPGYTFEPAAPIPGLMLYSGSGVLSGMPTTSGCFTFRVTATDTNQHQGYRDYTVCICGNPTLLPPALPPATFGVPYRFTLNVAGGCGPYSFSITDGNLPLWLSLSQTGVLSGTPDINDPIVPDMVISPGT